MHRQGLRGIVAGLAVAAATVGALVGAADAVAAAPTTSPNLIRNGNAEGALGRPVPGWTTPTNSLLEAQAYGQGGFPLLTDPGPANRGAAFFAGGQPPAGHEGDRLAAASQTRPLTAYASGIAAGTATYSLVGWLGGYNNQRDYATLEIDFLGAGGAVLGSAMIGPVTPTDRNIQTGLLKRSAAGAVPVGARKVLVTLTMRRLDGSYNDGYADNLSLKITTA